jgi:N-acetylglucosaminyl-diphospho-decaprenol L-rhamnosyltransferase
VTAPRVALVVVNFRSAALTDRMLAGAASGADEVIVVDCTPDDPGLAEVAARHGARLVAPGTNLGYGRAANLGAEHVQADVLVVANPDLVVDAAGLRRLATAAQGAGLVAPRFAFPDGGLQRSAHRREPRFVVTAFDLSVPFQAIAARWRPDWHPTLLSSGDHGRPQACRSVLGALMAVDLVAFRSVGGFDPAYFMYREETDLCRRLRDAGWGVRHDPSVEVVHDSGGSTGRDRPVATRPEHLTSHYRYIERHWGRLAAIVARVIGVVAAATSAVSGPDRRAWRETVRWHLALR